MKALVTGGGGFVAGWLNRALAEKGVDVVLAGLGPKPTIDHRAPATWEPLDIRDATAVAALVDRHRPDQVYHLAGISFPPAADDRAAETFDINVVGAVNLLGALAAGVRAETMNPVVIVAGSATQYGIVAESALPLRETEPQRPVSVYGASKAAQEIVALQIWRSTGLRVVCTRSFNHSGVGHGPEYLLPSLVRRAMEQRAAGNRRFEIGNDTIRDYLHVTDAVAAYVALATAAPAGEVFNVCSGVGVRASELARDVLQRLDWDAEITTAPALSRATDLPALIGDPSKLRAATDWRPLRSHRNIIDDLIHAATN